MTTAHGEPGDDAEIGEGTILRGLVGSTVHGLAHGGQDDRDEMGVYVEPPWRVLGTRALPHAIRRTKPEGVRSGPGDLDLVQYSLRRYAQLAVRQSPTVLLLLFVPEPDLVVTSELGRDLRARAALFVTRTAGAKFLGYLRGQAARVFERGRPELMQAQGYDTKHAMHALRLAHQGRELMLTGEMPVPVTGAAREQIMAVRLGEVPLEQARVLLARAESGLQEAIERSPLPEQVDVDAVDRLLVDLHLRSWRERGLS